MARGSTAPGTCATVGGPLLAGHRDGPACRSSALQRHPWRPLREGSRIVRAEVPFIPGPEGRRAMPPCLPSGLPSGLPPRPCCRDSRTAGHARCWWCGVALDHGRPPSEHERYQTSLEAREARQRQIEQARRSRAAIDAGILAMVRASIPEGTGFSYGELTMTGVSSLALKHALMRLTARGLIRLLRHRRLRLRRSRPVWCWLTESPAGMAGQRSRPAAPEGTAALRVAEPGQPGRGGPGQAGPDRQAINARR